MAKIGHFAGEAHRAESERLLEVFGDVLAAAREATAAEAGSEEGPAAGPGTAGEADDEQTARRAGTLVLKALESGGGLERLSGSSATTIPTTRSGW